MKNRFKFYTIMLLALLSIIGYHLYNKLQSAESFAQKSVDNLALCKKLKAQLNTKATDKKSPKKFDATLSSRIGTYAEKAAKFAGANHKSTVRSSQKQIKNTNYKLVEFKTQLSATSIDKITKFAHSLWSTHKILPTYILLRAQTSQPSKPADKWANTIIFTKTFYSPK